MLVALAAACLVVAIVAVVVARRMQRRAEELDRQLDAAHATVGRLEDEAAAAEERQLATTRERDDALDRVQRARRDAAEVANRLRDETAARSAAQAEAESAAVARDELERTAATLTAELEAARAAGAPAEGDTAEVLWALTLDRIERIWWTSISLHGDEPSPLAGTEDLFRTAVGIVVDAAREEAGADIDVEWSGDRTPVPAHRAVLALATIEAIVASLAKSAGQTIVRIDTTNRGIGIAVESDGRTVPVPALPDAVAEADGRYRVS